MAYDEIEAALEALYSGDIDGAESALRKIGGDDLTPPDGLAPVDEAAFHEGVGGIHLAQGNAEPSVASYRKMIELEEKGDVDKNGHATSWGKLGEALLTAGEHEEGIEAFDKAVALKEEADAPLPSRLNLSYQYATSLFQNGKHIEAAAQFDKALELAEEAGADDATLATLIMYKAESLKHKIAPMQASIRVQKEMQGANAPPQIAQLEAQLEVQFKQAIELYRRAKDLAGKANMPEDFQLQIQRSMSEAYHDAGRYVKGVMQRKKLIEMAEKQGVAPLEIAFMWHGLGESQREMGQVPEAVESYRKAITLKEKNDAENVSLGKTWYSMGECYAGGEKWDPALEALIKAKDLEENSGAEDPNHIGRLRKYWNTLGLAMQAAGKEEEGKLACEKANSIK